jgi:hypothetical protein
VTTCRRPGRGASHQSRAVGGDRSQLWTVPADITCPLGRPHRDRPIRNHILSWVLDFLPLTGSASACCVITPELSTVADPSLGRETGLCWIGPMRPVQVSVTVSRGPLTAFSPGRPNREVSNCPSPEPPLVGVARRLQETERRPGKSRARFQAGPSLPLGDVGQHRPPHRGVLAMEAAPVVDHPSHPLEPLHPYVLLSSVGQRTRHSST